MRIEEEAYRPDKRAEFADNVVMLTSNQRHDFPFEPMMLALGTGLYKEQVRWREAATGRLITESDFFEPMSPNTAVTPGFGGRGLAMTSSRPASAVTRTIGAS